MKSFLFFSHQILPELISVTNFLPILLEHSWHLLSSTLVCIWTERSLQCSLPCAFLFFHLTVCVQDYSVSVNNVLILCLIFCIDEVSANYNLWVEISPVPFLDIPWAKDDFHIFKWLQKVKRRIKFHGMWKLCEIQCS
jgi:hypothetical protein